LSTPENGFLFFEVKRTNNSLLKESKPDLCIEK
jgi:hypothetical protein